MRQQTVFQYDPDIGYTYLPILKLRMPHESGGYLLSTNSYGFRDVEWCKDAAPNCINVFGDSFTAGDGVSNKARWSEILGKMLPSYSFRNFGLAGTGTDQQYLAWRKFGSKFPMGITIIAVLVENIRRVTAGYRAVEGRDGEVVFRAKPYYEFDNGELALRSTPVPKDPIPEAELGDNVDRGGRHHMLRKMISKAGLKPLIQAMTSYQPVPDYDSPDSEGWVLMNAILRQWVSELGSPTVIIPMPLYHHVEELADPSPYQKRFAEFSQSNDCYLIDPLPRLLEYPKKQRRAFRFEKDVHLTNAGHKAIAEAIEPRLREILEGLS